MEFPFSLFGDLLAEFQKYLTDRISKPVYWVLGLIVVTLGIITGSLVGWSTLLDAWHKTDTFYKLVLSGGAVVIFLLLAYLLGRLQGMVERWFQGDWPRWWSKRTGQLARYHAIWDKREDTFRQMADLYGAISTEWGEITQWGQRQDADQGVLQTKRTLPRYSIITHKDLEMTTVTTVPLGALRDLDIAIGMMTLHPIDAKTIVTDADVVHLPAGLDNAVITALSVSSLIAPTGLIPGDLIVIYAQRHKQEHAIMPLKTALVVAVQPTSCEKSTGTKANLVHLTLAIAPSEIASFGMLSGKHVQRIVRLISPLTNISPEVAPEAHNPGHTEAIVQMPPLDTMVADQINKLDQQYKTGQQWLEGLREGILESKIPSHMEALTEAFTHIENMADTLSREQLENWRSKVNEYRNGWICLLKDAFKEMEHRIDHHRKTFSQYYPATREMVAPTAIGNILRAVDSYCDMLYGLDIALVLPRLQVVMEQSTRERLAKAHDQLALFEWIYLGSIAIGIIGTILAFCYQHYWLSLLLWFLVLPVPQCIFYPAALTAALDYAASLRLAVDCERGKVIKQAGFSLPSPTNQEQEKALWKKIQQWWIYGTSPGDYTLTMEGASSEKNS